MKSGHLRRVETIEEDGAASPIDNNALPRQLQEQHGNHRTYRCMQYRPRGSTIAKIKSGELKPTAFASRHLNDAEKYSISQKDLNVIWGLERLRFHSLGKQMQPFSDHQPHELLPGKQNKKITSAV